ncbi:uncharacterized protein LOC127010995 [Drosophila biarmipes]|uniref:uncharacterized protein LOC127010995 n=1 Tax=Drosophila biarmipes TaxID=125945 RepID=UPI0021CCECD2|nr:uncharacterized protein LOC127010995 [Drosophila biarmipes]XP_050743525.1 uncharacterized protein LOC127010995 [Drosophila biarmipes]
MKYLIMMLALVAVIWAAPQGFGKVNVYSPGVSSPVNLRAQEGYGDFQFFAQNKRLRGPPRVESGLPVANVGVHSEGSNGGHIRFDDRKAHGWQGVQGCAGPYIGYQATKLNFRQSGGPAGQTGYSGVGPKVVREKEDFKNGHHGLPNGSNLGSPKAVGPQVVGQGERIKFGHLGVDKRVESGKPSANESRGRKPLPQMNYRCALSHCSQNYNPFVQKQEERSLWSWFKW